MQLLKEDLETLRKEIDKWDLVTSKYLMSVNEYTDIVNWSTKRRFLICA